MVAFRIAGLPYQNSSANDGERLSQVNVFHFNGDDFLMRTDVDDPYAANIGLPTNSTTRIYCVSGTDLTAAEGVKEADFAAVTVTSPEGAVSAPLFYSGVVDLNE